MQTRSNEKQVISVCGPLDPSQVGVTDAHNHVWIEPVPGAAPGSPVSVDRESIAAELIDYRLEEGSAIVDCQPGRAGRNGVVMQALSRESGVHILASTGYHLKKYYAPQEALFAASSEKAADYFISELTEGLEETLQTGEPVLAGLIKIACEERLEKSPLNLMEAAAAASIETGAAIQIHTEKGADGENIVQFLLDQGLPAERLILSHVDKRCDPGFHRSMAGMDVLLEYDTFYRPQYQPEQGVWPLLAEMVAAGYDQRVAVATDMADASLWARMGGGPGLVGMFRQIIPRMQSLGFSPETIRRLCGENVILRLRR